MKNLMKILTVVSMASVFSVACSSDAKNKTRINMQAYNDSVKHVQDSVRLDSFQRAEAVKKEAAIARQERAENTRTVIVQQPGTVVVQQQQKKGMSSAAKGAIIGGVAGAATGILVDKKDGRGAVIGGVVGAGTGYTIGRSKDKRTGRAPQ
ncbi:MAG TPA: hypothetical protein DIT07_01615 [Sphingobacteriaceae bacterium]|nr:hypothetical protein [Sphingobacteriaceae bacterium]